MEKEYFSILGFRIEKAASFTSLAAFILALWGATYATISFLRGPSPEFIQPEAIVAYRDFCEHQRTPTVGFVTRISVLNSAPQDYPSVIHDIRLEFKVGEKIFEFYAEKFAEFGDATNLKKGRVGCESEVYEDAIFYVDPKQFTNEVLVAGSSLFSSELLFLPYIPPCPEGKMDCYTRNYLDFDDFVNAIGVASKELDIMEFKFSILHDFDTRQSKSCHVNTNPSVVWALNTYNHFDVNCIERISL